MWSILKINKIKLQLILALSFGILIQCTKDPLIFEMPPFKIVTLENGLKLYLFPDHKLPTLSMSFLFRAGAALDPHDKKGLAELTAALLTEGTKNKTSLELADEFEVLGAEFEASAS